MTYTIKDVAKKANVSIATVSRILNNQKGYSEKTKRKVLEAIEELDYHPNAIARGLINKKTSTIGVLFPALSSMLVTELLAGIEKAAHLHGSSVIVCHTESNGSKTMKYLQLLNEKRVDGIIFTSEVLKEEYYEFIQKMNIPLVLLSTESRAYSVPYVKVDDRHAAYSATQYLIKNGHTRIGMISGNRNDLIAGKPRIEGFKNALMDHGLPIQDSQIVYSEGFTFADGMDGLKKLRNQAPGVTAVFTASDEIAFGAISAAFQMGVKIPEDLSIIGYDNLKIAEMSIPPLTSLAQPFYEMGEKAARMIFDMMNGDQLVESRIMPHSIKERSSVLKKEE
ncbi:MULTISPECIES: LacI family DNA-binding transcriptional regulator [Bacillaceae]|uniref:LacI family DNA-binding transcriptional regulator n=1 Tax=Bacillaceae TaxID=186817 RepID=UPI000C7893F9|nr:MULTISPECIES: substrate-binding domain-containing protein [Bacillaceae]PLR67618.1 LacI family transcriptional regulator [Bacillus sp. UMB0893]